MCFVTVHLDAEKKSNGCTESFLYKSMFVQVIL